MLLSQCTQELLIVMQNLSCIIINLWTKSNDQYLSQPTMHTVHFTHRWSGCHVSQVIHCLCPVRVWPCCLPVAGSQIHTCAKQNCTYAQRANNTLYTVYMWTQMPQSSTTSYRYYRTESNATLTWPFLHPEASFLPSGDQAMHSTQWVWALQVCRGVSVNTSQNLTVLSPDPLASCRPSGLKHTAITASLWPAYGGKSEHGITDSSHQSNMLNH